ncbi:hypothetical protein PFISCL1PPCAC_14033, partial [Pristionchus fissidentatus]
KKFLEKKMRKNKTNHSQISWVETIAAKTKVKILSWSFSEVQAGKAASDRVASFVKRKMRSFKDAMHNVITPEEMFYAINATKHLRGVSVYVAKVVEEKKSTTKIPHISDLGHFDIHGNSAKFTIVETKEKVKLEGGKLASPAANIEDRRIIQDSLTKPPGAWGEPWFWLLRPERAPMFNQEPHDFDDEVVTGIPSPINLAGAPKGLFYCTDCGSSFLRLSNLINHIENGIHKIKPERVKLLDRALGYFLRYIEDAQRPISLNPAAEIINALKGHTDRPVDKGCYIRTVKKTGRYPPETKKFITDLFEKYAAKNAKLKADEAEKQMKESDLPPNKWMSNDQIKSLITVLTSKKPKTRFTRALFDGYDENDIMEEVEPAEEDITMTDEQMHEFLLPNLSHFFSDIKNPIHS